MYDLDFTDTCVGFWCYFQGVNSLLNGWLAIGILILIWFIALSIRLVQAPEEYLKAWIIANFSVLIFAFIFFIGELIKGQIIMIPLILLGISIIIKKISA